MLLVAGAGVAAAAAQVVQPMVNTTWAQGAPYNYQCPKDNNGEFTPVGCGAVALGQILNYHRVFSHGFGHAVYDNMSAGGASVLGTIDVDFDNLRFDWDNMLDNYVAGNYNTKQALAVSGLLYQTGAAMKMMWRTGGSSPANDGTMLWGIHHHLHISDKAMKHYRRDYSTSKWTKMLNAELAAGRPVLYGGGWYNPETGSTVGHIFVIDAVNEQGLYRANFGHGEAPKYVDLNVMNQNGTTPGGRGVCYILNSYMITDLIPKAGCAYRDNALITTEPVVLDNRPSLEQRSYAPGEAFHLSYTLTNYNFDIVYYEYCLGVYNGEQLVTMLYPSTSTGYAATRPGSMGLRGGSRLSFNHYYHMPDGLANGTYSLRFVSREKDTSSSWLPAYEIVPSSMTLSVADGRITLRLPVNRHLSPHLWLQEPPTVVDNEFQSKMPGTAFRLKFVNKSQSNFQDKIKFVFSDGREFEYVAAVYRGTKPTYDILVPWSRINLQGKSLAGKMPQLYYYDSHAGRYFPLALDDTHDALDINGDGTVDVGDVNAVLEAVLRGDYDSELDVNGDAAVDVGDVNTVLDRILNND